MKSRLLATIAISVGILSGAQAADTDISGEWSTHPGVKQGGGVFKQILDGLSGGQVTVGSLNPTMPDPRGRGQRGSRGDGLGGAPWDPNGPRVFGDRGPVMPRNRGGLRETALNANFKINRKTNALRGSLEFRQPDSYTLLKTAIQPDMCKGFDIHDGIMTGNTFTFKTHVDVRGVRVVTPWSGRLAANGGIILEPLETLPCAEGPNRGFGFGPGSNTLMFHRAEPAGEGLQGKWWTRDPGAIGVMEVKADAKLEAVTAFFENICREERKLSGILRGNSFTMTTASNARGYGETLWRGEMLSENVLRVTAQPPPQCMMERTAAYRLFPSE